MNEPLSFVLVTLSMTCLSYLFFWLRWKSARQAFIRLELEQLSSNENRRIKRLRQRKRRNMNKLNERAQGRMLRDEARAEDLNDQEARYLYLLERLDERTAQQGERSNDLTARHESNFTLKGKVKKLKRNLKRVQVMMLQQLEERAQLTSVEAQNQIVEQLTTQSQVVAQQKSQRLLVEAEAYRDERASELISLGRQRYYDPRPAERLISYVELPKNEQRDALLHPSGELLQMLKAVTHSEFIWDEKQPHRLVLRNSPETFSREVARITYQRWLSTNQLTEKSLVKQYERARSALENEATRAGKTAAERLNLRGVNQDILQLVGKLLFRTSYTQNQWQHAIEAAELCGMMAEELKMDVQLAKRATLLHDIGKVLWAETEAAGSHAVSGAVFARDHGEIPEIVHPIGAHHHDEIPSSPLAYLVIAADTLSGARPGARRETSEAFSQHVSQLNELCGELSGIRQHMVIQGGREVRLQVYPQKYDDYALTELTEDVAATIEDQCVFPGQIKVTALREVISSAVAQAKYRDKRHFDERYTHQVRSSSGERVITTWGGERGEL